MNDCEVAPMSDHCVSIRRLNNGFVIEATDPAIEKKNRASKGVYKNPRVEYAMKDFKDVLKWLKDNADVLSKPAEDEYATAFADGDD
jgi:hypothetical protein